ncbi:MAG: YfiM family protein, partial [Chlorobi bacterium]|nr:YfiM family protein [Chlorobiota bacterium]
MKPTLLVICTVWLGARDTLAINWERTIPFCVGTASAIVLSHVAQARHYWKVSAPFYINGGGDARYAAGADKFGHAMAGYATTVFVQQGLSWSGFDTTTATFIGAAVALINQTLVEYRDATSIAATGSEYPYLGWSWGDILANCTGLALPVAQQLWGGDVPVLAALRYKYSIHSSGKVEQGLYRSILDDYESQYHWLSVPISAMSPSQTSWLSRFFAVAIGHSVGGIVDKYGVYTYQGQHELWLALDYNLEAIPTSSPLLRGLLRVLNLVRLPSPCVRLIPTTAVFG